MNKLMGIYQILCKATNERYVGGSSNLLQRKRQHFHTLKLRLRTNPNLQHEYDIRGKDEFIFSVLEIVQNYSELVSREQYWIDLLHPEYNINPIAGKYMGDYVRTPKAMAKRKESMKHCKRTIPPEVTEARRQRWLGKNNPNSGRVYTEEERKKLSKQTSGSKNPNYGKPRPESTRQKIGNSNAHTYHGFVSPEGQTFSPVINLSGFCREHNLTISKMVQVDKNKKHTHKGWAKLLIE